MNKILIFLAFLLLEGCSSTDGKPKEPINRFSQSYPQYYRAEKDRAKKQSSESEKSELEDKILKLENENLKLKLKNLEKSNKTEINHTVVYTGNYRESKDLPTSNEPTNQNNSSENNKIEKQNKEFNKVTYGDEKLILENNNLKTRIKEFEAFNETKKRGDYFQNKSYFLPQELTFNDSRGRPNNKTQKFHRNDKYYQKIADKSSNESFKEIIEKIEFLKNSKYKDLGEPKKEFETTSEYSLYQSYLEYNFRNEAPYNKDYSVEFKDISCKYLADLNILSIFLPDSAVYDKTSKVLRRASSNYKEAGVKIGEQVISVQENLKEISETTIYRAKFTKEKHPLNLRISPETYKKYFYKKHSAVTVKYVYSLKFDKDILIKEETINPLEIVYSLPTTLKYVEVYYNGDLIGSLSFNN